MNWIAVSDRLPPDGQNVVVGDNSYICTALRRNGVWMETDYGGDVTQERVRCARGCCYDYEDKECEFYPTHWMEIVFPE